ncbi:hypothetical protein L0665_10175 [Methanogenium marinum]|uniref:Uncharacterized protein n=1 Tax=Methanogenium marinum TaxID=348610 RepID=A0A9Q4KR38_9EURY|nr:hypothetical protein [Methanogenium marinum]MDE4908973.1 hypothetical protein [Methanogenium marinum]
MEIYVSDIITAKIVWSYFLIIIHKNQLQLHSIFYCKIICNRSGGPINFSRSYWSYFIFGLLILAICASGCTSSGETSKSETQPAINYQPGDVISGYESAEYISCGWVISRYESDEDLYYGFKVEIRDGVWGLTSTDEWDLWSKENTEEDFPYVLGHMDLKGPEDKWSQSIYYD